MSAIEEFEPMVLQAKIMPFMCACVLSCALGAGCVQVTDEPTSSSNTPPENIVYTTLAPRAWEVRSFSASGAPLDVIATNSALDYDPEISPDGRWLIFTSERRGNPDLWALDLERDVQPILLTAGDSMQDAAAFSPDGKQLAFVDTRDGNAEIYVMPFRPDSPQEAFAEARNVSRSPRGDFRPAFSPDGSKIAFSSDREEPLDRLQFPATRHPVEVTWPVGTDIYVVNVDGSGEAKLTSTDGYDGSPVWSNGGTIYFYSERSGQPQIWRMDSDGSDQRPLVESKVALSPTIMSAERIAFTVADSVESNTWQMMSVKLDGSGLREEIETDQDCRGPEVHPVNGQIFCYGTVDPDAGSTRYAATSLYFAEGQRGLIELPDRTVHVQALHRHVPEFSPDGKEVIFGSVVTNDGPVRGRLISAPIARGEGTVVHDLREMEFPLGIGWAADWFVFNRGGPGFEPMSGPGDVWAMRSDGTGLTNLTPEPNTNDGWPDIANTGRVVFRTGRDNNFEIYTIDVDGKNLRRLTDHPASDTMPAISLDGNKVVFSSERDGTFVHNFDLYLADLTMDAELGSLRRLTDSKGQEMHAKFSPDGNWIVYTAQRGGRNDELYISVQAGQTYGEIYAQRLSDGFVVRLTHNKWEDGLPAWGPATSTTDPSAAIY